MHVADARPPAFVVCVLAVAVRVRNAVPDDGERRPTDDERGSEQCHVVSPAHVDEGRENVDEVATPALRYVLAGDVTRAVLVDDASSLTGGEASTTVHQRLNDSPVSHRFVARLRHRRRQLREI